MVLHQMEYFIAVCDHGGITPAAEALSLTPQALSKSIRKLEEELDAPLFFHEKKGLTLTPFGKKAREEIRHLLSEYHSMTLRLSHISAQEKGRLRLACPHSIPNALPLEKLQKELFPQNIRLDIIEVPDLLAEEMVEREVADIGFTAGIPQSPELFRYSFLRRYYLCAVVSKNHPLAARSSVSVRDLEKEKIIAKSPYYSSFHMLEQEAARHNITLNYILQSPDEIRWLYLVKNMEGVGIGVTFMDTAKSLVSQDTVTLPFEEELPWDVYLITRKGHYLSPAAQKLISRLKTWQDQKQSHV